MAQAGQVVAQHAHVIQGVEAVDIGHDVSHRFRGQHRRRAERELFLQQCARQRVVGGAAQGLVDLGFVLVGSLWLELVLHTRVLRRWRRLLLSMVLPVAVFMLWDAYAIAQDHWYFNTDRILNIIVFAGVPIDELLFFICIPLASILTLEAVRSVMQHWPVGDER